MDKPEPSNRCNFATTNWSVVLAAGRGSSADARRALEILCEAYWFPLYAFVRRRGRNESDAKDLVQSFILSLLDRNDFKLADQEKGRFRTFLLSALNNFLANEHDYRMAQKRGGGKKFISIDWTNAESQYVAEPYDNVTPERAFDRQWGLSVINQALDALRQELILAGNESHYIELSRFLIGDSMRARESYAKIGARLEMTESAVKSAVHRLRGRYRNLLRSQIADTVSSDEQVDEEIRTLFKAISRE